MTVNEKKYLKSMATAALIEAAVLLFTFYPLMERFMDHSAAARHQRSVLNEFLGLFGLIFHLPSIMLAFWMPPLIPLVQIFLMGTLLYGISKASGKSTDEISLKEFLGND